MTDTRNEYRTGLLDDAEAEALFDDLDEIRERVTLRRGFQKDPDTPEQRDAEALLRIADRLRVANDAQNARMAQLRKYQMAAAVGMVFSRELDEAQRDGRPISDALADQSRAKAQGAVAVLQDLLFVLGEIEGDEECEEAWEVVQREMDAARTDTRGERTGALGTDR